MSKDEARRVLRLDDLNPELKEIDTEFKNLYFEACWVLGINP